MRFAGRCWLFGDNIPTDRLVKSRYVFEPMSEIVKHVLEDLDPEFRAQVRPGDIVIAGRHFGQSSGRAIATKALEVPGVGEIATAGAELAVDLASGVVTDTATGRTREGRAADPFLVEMLEAGGLIALAAQRSELFRV